MASLNFNGVPKFFWGLFLLSALSLCSAENFEIYGRGGILLHRDDGQITLWSGGASYVYGGVFENKSDFAKVSSGMPWLSTEILAIGYSAELKLNTLRPKITAGLVTSSDIEILSGGAEIKNGGMSGFYIGSALSFGVRNVEITPSLLFANIRFGDGDFYRFYGKPNIPAFIHIGLSAEYEKTHKIGFTYDKADIAVLSNKDSLLFRSDNYCIGGNYKYLFTPQQKPWKIYAVSGISYADVFADGALTAANQQYFLFPYLFYNLTGRADAFIGWAMLSADISGKYLSRSVRIGAGNIFGGRLYADAHYQYRKFYGDEEANENIVKINLAGSGIVFFDCSLKTGGLTISDKVRVYLELRKILGYYWGMDKFADIGGTDKKTLFDEIDWGSLMKTVLLSGLSGELRIVF